MRKDVFISYSSKDADIALDVYRGLEASGINCWIAGEGIDPGKIWADEIVHAIRNARIMIMILSPNLMQSRHTRRELVLADSEGLEIIPFRVKDCAIEDAWLYFLCDRHWRDACNPPMDQHIKVVAVGISKYLKLAEMQPESKARKDFQRESIKNRWFEERPIAPYETLGPRLPVRIPCRVNNRLDQPSRFIEAHQSTIPLIGRQKEIAWLEEFRDTNEPFSWAVIKGEGGMGKSRLAYEFCKKCSGIGWHSGVLSKGDLERFVNSVGSDKWEYYAPIFAVVDYASAKVDLIIKLMSILSESVSDGKDCPIRLLLLEREANRSEGWLHDLLEFAENNYLNTIHDTFYRNEALLLKPPVLEDSLDPFGATRMIIESTMKAWSEHKERAQPEKVELTHEQWRRVQKATSDRPLYLMLASIHACEVNDPKALYHVNRTNLLKAAVTRELHYIKRQSKDPMREAAVKYMTGVLCLTGLSVIRDRHWQDCIGNAMSEIGCKGLMPREVLEALELVFPDNFQGEEDSCQTNDDLDRSAIQPDILAAAFCWEVFSREKAGFVNCCRYALDIGGIRTWPKLIRLVQDLHGLTGYGNVAGQVETLLEGDGRPLNELEYLADYLPERSETLAKFGNRLYEILAEKYRNEEEDKLKLGRILVRWTTHLAFTGADSSSGINVAQEAIDILSDLPKEEWTEWAPLLARAYHYMETHLQMQERYRQGLVKLNEAIAIRRELYQKDPERFLLELTDSLNNKSNNLAFQDMLEEALKVSEEAVRLIEELPRKAGYAAGSRIARYYNVKGENLINLKRYQEARKPIEKSVLMRRELYHLDADVHAVPLLYSLKNYRHIAKQERREEDEAKILEEEITILKDLCTRRPEYFIGSYVEKLCLLAKYHLSRGNMGRMKWLILEGSGHVISIYSWLPTNEVGLAIIKGSMAIASWLEGNNQFSFGLQILDPALKLNCQLAQRGYYIKGVLEMMLRVLAKEQGMDENKAEAEVFLDWYTNRKESSSQAPDRAVANMAHELGIRCFCKDDFVLAKRLTAIAVKVNRKRMAEDKDQDILHSLINSINNLSFFQMKTGDTEAALVDAANGIALIDEYAGYRDHHLSEAEANIIDTYAQILLNCGRIDEAADTAKRAMRIYRASVEDPQVNLGKEELILALCTQGRIEFMQGRVDAAFESFTDAFTIISALEKRMEAHREIECRKNVIWAIDEFQKTGHPFPDELVRGASYKVEEARGDNLNGTPVR